MTAVRFSAMQPSNAAAHAHRRATEAVGLAADHRRERPPDSGACDELDRFEVGENHKSALRFLAQQFGRQERAVAHGPAGDVYRNHVLSIRRHVRFARACGRRAVLVVLRAAMTGAASTPSGIHN